MPWWFFKNMTDDDLKAIFAYLKTVKPVHHRVDNSETAGECRRCNHKPAGSEAGQIAICTLTARTAKISARASLSLLLRLKGAFHARLK